MASFMLEEFVGDGALKEVLPSLVKEGWDDVPTLKMINREDMEALQLDQRQGDALELRTYLHDRSLMQYADKLEASGKLLAELLNTSPSVLTTEYGMKRGHVARFIDRSSACGVLIPPSISLPARSRRGLSGTVSITESAPDAIYSPYHSPDKQSQISDTQSQTTLEGQYDTPFITPEISKSDEAVPKTLKGMVSKGPPAARLCGFIPPPDIGDTVAPLPVLERISVQKLTPEYKLGVDPWAYGKLRVPPPMKASDLWLSKTTLIFCIRRPGCVMCRAEAHQIYREKPFFDALGIQLVAVLNELIEAEVKAFWPKFWGGMVLFDINRDFFKALGGGVLPKENFVTGFLLNPTAIANFQRARKSEFHNNLHGDPTVKGGIFVVRQGKGGVAYQFVESNYGDWAPLEEVKEVCMKLKQELN